MFCSRRLHPRMRQRRLLPTNAVSRQRLYVLVCGQARRRDYRIQDKGDTGLRFVICSVLRPQIVEENKSLFWAIMWFLFSLWDKVYKKIKKLSKKENYVHMFTKHLYVDEISIEPSEEEHILHTFGH